jgi:hypothetical protein
MCSRKGFANLSPNVVKLKADQMRDAQLVMQWFSKVFLEMIERISSQDQRGTIPDTNENGQNH